MPFLFLLFFLLGRLLFHVAGFPDVDFRFRARLEPFDVLAVRVDQQYGDDEREHIGGIYDFLQKKKKS